MRSGILGAAVKQTPSPALTSHLRLADRVPIGYHSKEQRGASTASHGAKKAASLGAGGGGTWQERKVKNFSGE